VLIPARFTSDNLIEMGEYAAPFSSVEGFVAGPDTELSELLTVLEQKEVPTDMNNNISLLKDMISQKKGNLDDLVRTAKQLNPVVQKVAPLDTAYDAAFETATEQSIPSAGATLQGFAILLLIISYISLVLVSVIAVNIITGNAMTAGKVLVGLLVIGFIGYAILVKYG
jgi:hypothetical protein